MNMTDTRLELMEHRKNPNCATTHSCVNEKEKKRKSYNKCNTINDIYIEN